MFSGQTDASKAALLALVGQAKERGIELIDTQIGSPHVASLGGTVMPRSAFLTELTRLIEQPTPPWPRPPA